MNGFARNAAPFFRSSRLRSSPAQPEMYKTGICGRYVNAPGFVDEYAFRGRGGQVLEPFFELAHLFQELGFSSPLDAHRRGGDSRSEHIRAEARVPASTP